jgi:superfamily II DNA or RNA helicase
VPKPSSGERRKQLLKQRRADERRDFELAEAESLFRDALRAFRSGDEPAAGRWLKKALALHPEHVGSLTLLAQIHDAAEHYAEALGYLRQLRRLTDDPTPIYNSGVLYGKMGQPENSAAAMREFLQATQHKREPKWQKLRESARALMDGVGRPAARAADPAKMAPPKPPAAEPPPRFESKNSAEVCAAAKRPDPPRASVFFQMAPAPDFARTGNLADYFLRRQWLQLRLAQNFADLVCLPSLHGVDAYVYQQETVRKVLRHFKGRALLADEVGLGKTIEACLVLKEYWVRGLVRKALVLTPPSLVSQWKGELIEKFGLAPVSPDTTEFRRDPAQFWREEPLVVASIAQARLDAHASYITAVPWDMVIVDEAHCLKNRASANWRLVDLVQKKFILMLTATPVENNLIELYNLITLLKPGLLATEAEFRKSYVTAGKANTPKNPEQLRNMLGEVMIRNTRAAADVQLPRRIAATVAIRPSETEAQIYEIVSKFVSGRYKTASGAAVPRMSLDLLQRQAGSSPSALGRAVMRALRDEAWTRSEDRGELESILEVAAGIEESGKGRQLGEMLSAHSGKAVVFTEFIDTLEHLARVCEERGISHSIFRGDFSRAEKDAAVAHFRDEARVLLSTGAGGEGRNLQFADTVVNFDLPWNPMRIEQRVGRVHRIGQTRDVFVFNYCQQGSVEEQLLRVLHDKINMFELVVGEMDAILGTLDDSRDFAEIVMDLWLTGRESGEIEQAFDQLAGRLLEAKKQHVKVRQLDDSLFARDFEV